MRYKYFLFYSLVVLIILLTIAGMFYLKNHPTFEEKKKNIISDIKINEAKRYDQSKEWVYRLDNDNKIINIPVININDKEIDKLNESFLDQNIISSDFLYSVNDYLLSILYIKRYENETIYETYNIDLGNTRLMGDMDVLNYLKKSYHDFKKNCYLSIEFELKKYHYDQETYNSYYQKTINEFNNNILNGNLKIYIGSNKEIMTIMDIYRDTKETMIINIIDKNL